MKVNHFIGNEEDNLHCFQCCYRMALKYLIGRDVSLQDSELETGFIKGKQTWAHAGLLSFLNQGLQVRLIEEFDYVNFSRNPYEYLRAYINNEEIFENILETSDLDKEKSLVSDCLADSHCVMETRTPSIADIDQYNTQDSIVIANVNYWRLLKKDGYDGHFVIIEKFNDKKVTLQNPGLPPIPSQIVETDDFLSAWKNNDGADLSNLIIVSRG